MTRESVTRTLSTAVLVAFVCSGMVAGAVHLLRPLQHAYQLVDRNRAILHAAGLIAPDTADRQVVSEYLRLDVRLVDLQQAAEAPGPADGGSAASGSTAATFVRPSAVPDPRSYDHWSVTENSPPDLLLGASGARTPVRARYVPVYLVWRDGSLKRLVLPVQGQGMWSTIYGYLALHADLETVAALHIYRHGETPGIGDRIEAPAWLDSWAGKRLHDADGRLRIDVVREPVQPNHQVDLISGATITSKAVGRMIRSALGESDYGAVLDRLRRYPPEFGRSGG